MAKRKRLTLSDPAGPGPGTPPLETKSVLSQGGIFPLLPAAAAPRSGSWGMPGPAPIARVTADAATSAALSEVTEALRSAREDGRLVQRLPLEAVDAAYLVRDRMSVDAEAMQGLRESLRARGQQTPIEAVDLGDGRFGLISGWRRLGALRQLFEETGEARFATVLTLLRRPAESSDAYIAMVEENEIRVGLSYYERARIAVRAAEAGVFPNEEQALKALFGSASRAKRSKIGSFMRLYHGLDRSLGFPAAIPERLGLALVRRIEDPAALARLRDRLRKAAPATPEAELALLNRALGKGAAAEAAAEEVPEAAPQGPLPAADSDSGLGAAAGIVVERFAPGRLVLCGAGVDAGFHRRLLAWLDTAAKDG